MCFIAAALVLGGYAVLGGDMQVGTLLALVICARRVFETGHAAFGVLQHVPVRDVGIGEAVCLPLGKPGLPIENPVLPFSKTGPAVSSPEDSARGALVELDNAVCSYTSERHACKERAIEPGTTVALVGPTGVTVDDCQTRGAILRRVSSVLCASTAWMCATRPIAQLRRGAYADAGGCSCSQASWRTSAWSNPQASDGQVKAATKAVGADAFDERLLR